MTVLKSHIVENLAGTEINLILYRETRINACRNYESAGKKIAFQSSKIQQGIQSTELQKDNSL